MKQELSFSLIIPAYNEEDYIGACLEAVLANTKGAFKDIIVVDNASTDRTAEVAGSYPGVTVVHEARKGLTRARQCGYQASTADILVYVDADTLPPPGWIDEIKAEYRKDDTVACVSGPYVYYDLPSYTRPLVMIWDLATKVVFYFTHFLIIGGNFAIRRDVLDKMGGFDQDIEFYGEDVDIGQRAHVFGKMVYLLRLKMPTSGRRLQAQGILQSGNIYAQNLFSIIRTGRPATLEYEDFR